MISKRKPLVRLPIDVSLVIPAYNNEGTIVDQVSRCEKILPAICRRFEIIIADDASCDGTAALLKKQFGKNRRIRVLINKDNLGIAKNIRQLYRRTKYSYIALYSADGDWRPEDIEQLLTTAYRERADITIGNRRKHVYTLSRRIISHLYRALPKLLFGIDTIDPGSIKVIKREVFQSVQTVSTSVFFEAELIIRAVYQGYHLTSIPVSFVRKGNKTSGVKVKVIFQSLIDLLWLKITRGV